MLFIDYKPMDHVSPIGDGRLDEFVDAEIRIFQNFQDLYGSTYERNIIVSQALVIDRFRLAICKKQIPHTDVVFTFNNELLYPTEDGRLPKWPNGFCDQSVKILAGLCSSRRKRDEQ